MIVFYQKTCLFKINFVSPSFAWLFAWLSAFIVERMGRKQLIMIASLAFTLASLIMGAAVNKYMLLVGRAVAGNVLLRFV